MSESTATAPEALGYLLRRAHAVSLACGTETIPEGRHPSDMAVVAAIEAFGPTSQRALAHHVDINPRVMVQILDRLEADRMVARTRDPQDRRSYAVELTRAGTKLARDFDRMADAHTACLTRNLGTTQRRRLNSLLGQLLHGLEDMPPKLADRTGFLVARTHFVMRAKGKALLEPIGIEPQEYGALLVLDELGPLSQQRLAQELGVSGTIVVQHVDRLEDGGLVERRRDPDDRRVHRVTLTSAGEATLRRARPIAREGTAELTAPIGPQAAEELRRLLVLLIAV